VGVEGRSFFIAVAVCSGALMPLMKHSQPELLRQLLACGKLSPSELGEVRRLYDDLVAGRVGGLTTQQTQWAERLRRQCGIALRRAMPREDKKPTREAQQRLLDAFEALPRPKAPPGRR
jgi:hypothetical protein